MMTNGKLIIVMSLILAVVSVNSLFLLAVYDNGSENSQVREISTDKISDTSEFVEVSKPPKIKKDSDADEDDGQDEEDEQENDVEDNEQEGNDVKDKEEKTPFVLTITNPIDDANVTEESIDVEATTNKDAVCKIQIKKKISDSEEDEWEAVGESGFTIMEETGGTEHSHGIENLQDGFDYRVKLNCKSEKENSGTHFVDFFVTHPIKPMSILFTHPRGGIYEINPVTEEISLLVNYNGYATDLIFDDENLYFVPYSKRIAELMTWSPDDEVSTVERVHEDYDPWGIRPWDIDLAINNGDIYYTHPRGGIYKINLAGEINPVLTDIGFATNIVFDDNENLYFVEYSRRMGELNILSPDNEIIKTMTIFEDYDPMGLRAWNMDLAIKDKDIYFAHPRGGIYKLNLDSKEISPVVTGVGSVTDLVFDDDGNLYFVEYSRYVGKLSVLSPDGEIDTVGTIFEDYDPLGIRPWDIDLAVW